MKFENNPQLFLTKKEFETLENALKLCLDMDEATRTEEDEDGFPIGGCNVCPFNEKCSHISQSCVYTAAYSALKQIIDIAIVK